jgi:hypothetical protein
MEGPAWLVLCLAGASLIVLALLWTWTDNNVNVDEPDPDPPVTVTVPSTTDPPPSTTEFIPWGYGDDPHLDGHEDLCAAGFMEECDLLYLESALGSGYENYGATCGYRLESWDAGNCWTYNFDPYTFGDDAHLDEHWILCAAGSGVDCDDLYAEAPAGSEYEYFGDTCGDRYPAGTVWCEQELQTI